LYIPWRYRDLSISCLLLLGSSSAPPQYCVCFRDIEIYLSTVFFYLVAVLPYHINLSPKTCRPITRNKYLRKKVKKLLSKYLTIFFYIFITYSSRTIKLRMCYRIIIAVNLIKKIEVWFVYERLALYYLNILKRWDSYFRSRSFLF